MKKMPEINIYFPISIASDASIFGDCLEDKKGLKEAEIIYLMLQLEKSLSGSQ